MSAKSRQAPKPNTTHLAQGGIAARGSSTPKYIVTTTMLWQYSSTLYNWLITSYLVRLHDETDIQHINPIVHVISVNYSHKADSHNTHVQTYLK